VFGLAAGVAIARWAPLPRWLGWAVILIGIALASPAVIVGIVALALWTATVGILVWRRGARPAPVGTPEGRPGYAAMGR